MSGTRRSSLWQAGQVTRTDAFPAVTPAERPWWRRSRTWLRIARDVISIAAAAALLAWLLPRIAGVSWAQIVAPLTALSPGLLLLCAVLQLTALWLFTFTITGSLPGIRHGQALTVNLAGSFIANTVPFGGAIAVGATYGLCRSWGFGSGAIGISVVLGGIWTAAAKILVPLLGLVALAGAGGALSIGIQDAVIAASAVLTAIRVLFVVVMASPRVARRVGGLAGRTVEAVLRLFGRERHIHWDDAVTRLHTQTRSVMRTGWAAMTFGTAGYFVVYFALFWLCLSSTGVSVPAGIALAAFALGRLLTSVGVTPGGLGLVEAGSVALLVSLGAPPAESAAGILLFTAFTHLLEIPFGAAAWLWYLARRKRTTAANPQPRPLQRSRLTIAVAADHNDRG